MTIIKEGVITITTENLIEISNFHVADGSRLELEALAVQRVRQALRTYEEWLASARPPETER